VAAPAGIETRLLHNLIRGARRGTKLAIFEVSQERVAAPAKSDPLSHLLICGVPRCRPLMWMARQFPLAIKGPRWLEFGRGTGSLPATSAYMPMLFALGLCELSAHSKRPGPPSAGQAPVWGQPAGPGSICCSPTGPSTTAYGPAR